MRRVCIYFAAIVVLGSVHAAAASAKAAPLAPLVTAVAKAGSVCTFGSDKYGAIGLPIAGGPDRPGVSGNEVRDIYRVFYTSWTPSGPVTGFAGWLKQSFDGRTAFAPAVSLAPRLANFSVIVSVSDANKLPLAQWVTTLARTLKVGVDVANLHLGDAATAVSPCFAHPWDGKFGLK